MNPKMTVDEWKLFYAGVRKYLVSIGYKKEDNHNISRIAWRCKWSYESGKTEMSFLSMTTARGLLAIRGGVG